VIVPARRRSCILAALLGLLLGGCAESSAAEQPTMVFAAASLTAPFEAIAQEFERRHPERKLELHFAGTPQLVVQIREGAPVDVFASADEPNMQRIVDAGQVLSSPRSFARNRLAIVTPKGNPKGIRGLSDLGRPDVRLLLCGPEVPAGRYAREALAKASVAARSLSDEPSVKAVVSKVQLGEVDAGIVYATDAASAAGEVDAVEIPDEHNVVASYPIAVLSAGGNSKTGEELVAFILAPDGQRILRSFGFSGP
jgi:molybdate transport system substrate-binding protein